MSTQDTEKFGSTIIISQGGGLLSSLGDLIVWGGLASMVAAVLWYVGTWFTGAQWLAIVGLFAAFGVAYGMARRGRIIRGAFAGLVIALGAIVAVEANGGDVFRLGYLSAPVRLAIGNVTGIKVAGVEGSFGEISKRSDACKAAAASGSFGAFASGNGARFAECLSFLSEEQIDAYCDRLAATSSVYTTSAESVCKTRHPELRSAATASANEKARAAARAVGVTP